jgi:hypothetical protein
MCASTTHNRSTCTLWANLQCLVCESEDCVPMDVQVQPRKCGGCGEFGHNKRTCPLVKLGALSLETSEESPMDVDTGTLCTKRVPRCPLNTHKAVQVTQRVVPCPVAPYTPAGPPVVDMGVVDEPWVWAPIRPMNRFN